MAHHSTSRSARWVAGLALCAAGLCHADTPTPNEFAWRAPLELPAGASLARVSVPAQALMMLQGSDARDLRVFNAAGEVVPFAFMGAPKADPTPPAPRTRAYAALPLYSAAAGNTVRPKGAVQVRIDEPGNRRSVWVQMDGADTTGAARLNSVLFATRDEKQQVTGIDVQATLPANTPVRVTVSTSTDLAQWTPEPVRGRIYRFEGEGAPVNMTLEFEHTIKLEGRYLRLDWDGQEGVAVASVAGVIASPAPAAPRVRGDLPAPQPAGSRALEIATGFAAPMAALALSTPRENTLVPVRVLGRNEASQPWRLLGQTVVWRLGGASAEAATNPPLALHGASARWLRIESTNGTDLSAVPLHAIAEFEPVQIVFLASGSSPYELATGRAGATTAALPLGTITGMLQGRKLEDLPSARVGTAVVHAPEAGPLARLWPGAPTGKTAVLWAVLLAGVLLLAGVAWSLMRQLKTTPPAP